MYILLQISVCLFEEKSGGVGFEHTVQIWCCKFANTHTHTQLNNKPITFENVEVTCNITVIIITY